jgi:Leucine-rich repeat (LRR) protein
MEGSMNAVVSSQQHGDIKAMDNAALTNENAEYKRRVKTLESDVGSLTEQHQSLQNLIVSKTKQLRDYRDKIAQLETGLKEAQGKLQLNVQNTGAALLLLEEEATTCRDDKEKAERLAEALAAESDALRRENQELRAQLKGLPAGAPAAAAPGGSRSGSSPVARAASSNSSMTPPTDRTASRASDHADNFIDDLDELLATMTTASPLPDKDGRESSRSASVAPVQDEFDLDMMSEVVPDSAFSHIRAAHRPSPLTARPTSTASPLSVCSEQRRPRSVNPSNQKMDFVVEAEEAEVREGQAAGSAGMELLMARVLEARYTMWATSAQQKSASVLWSQAERVTTASNEAHSMLAAENRNRHSEPLTGGEETLLNSLTDMVEELQSSFEQTRRYAVNLDTRYEASKLDLWAEVLGAVEPAIDDMEHNFSLFDPSDLGTLNTICEDLNTAAKYIPGKTILSQNTVIDQDGKQDKKEDPSSVLTMYSILRESKAITNHFNKLSNYLCEVFPEMRVLHAASTTPISRCLEASLMEHGGDYSALVEVSTCVLSVPSLAALGEALTALQALGVSARRRQLLVSASSRGLSGENDGYGGGSSSGKTISPEMQRRLRQPLEPCTQFSVVAVKNKFQVGYNAREESCGFRDCSVYLCLLNSSHPCHVVSLRLEVHPTGVSDGSNIDHWAHKLYKAAGPLKIFDGALRRHVGPVEKADADRIRDGLCNTVNMDLFTLQQHGGGLLLKALQESPYCALQEISLENSLTNPNEVRPLFEALTRHHRLRTLKLPKSEGVESATVFRDLSWENLYTHGKGMDPRFPSLQKLDMSFQAIRSPLPPFISTMFPSLQRLVLEGNEICGAIPPDLGNMTNLKQLILSKNKLEGTIPASIGQLVRLQEFQAWQNGLCGEIPASLGKLTNLQRLFIDSCRLAGPIPPELGDLASLQEFFCFDNELTGALPRELGKMSKLRYLGLNGNHLREEIPEEIGQLRSLQHLFLHENELTGSIPPSLGALSELTKLSLRKNFLRGNIPIELGNLFSLEALVLSDNQLSGVIPSQLGRLVGLEALSLSGNKLTGSIPASFCSFSRIKVVELSSNRLSGPIPSEIGSLLTLESLLLSYNDLSGDIPATIGNLTNLKTLELHGNMLQGVVPIELCNLVALTYLDLSKNRLQGSRKAQFYLEKRLPDCTVIIDSGQEPMDK